MKLVLTFHDVGATAGPLSFRRESLLALFDAFERRGTRVVALERLLDVRDDDKLIVALTFDDGLRSVHEVARPLIAERRWSAACFVVTDHVGGDNRWPGQPAHAPHYATMDWDALAELRDAGISIENHTRRHPDLRGLDATRLAEEIDGASAEIERRLGRAPRCFAYPYGHCDDTAVRAVEQRGLVGVTTEMGAVGPTSARAALPRIDVCYFDAPWLAARWGTPGFGAYLGLRRWGRALGARVRR